MYERDPLANGTRKARKHEKSEPPRTCRRTVVLISCAGRKRNRKSKAQELYVSPLFKKKMAYARALLPDAIYILSAKYGLLKLDEEIEPYDLTLDTMTAEEKRVWASEVMERLRKVEVVEYTNFIFLAGANYRRHLVEELTHHEAPMEGLAIGKQLKFLKERLK